MYIYILIWNYFCLFIYLFIYVLFIYIHDIFYPDAPGPDHIACDG